MSSGCWKCEKVPSALFTLRSATAKEMYHINILVILINKRTCYCLLCVSLLHVDFVYFLLLFFRFERSQYVVKLKIAVGHARMECCTTFLIFFFNFKQQRTGESKRKIIFWICPPLGTFSDFSGQNSLNKLTVKILSDFGIYTFRGRFINFMC